MAEDTSEEIFCEDGGESLTPRANPRYSVRDMGVVLSNHGAISLPFEMLARVGVTFNQKGDAYVSMWRTMEDGAMVIRLARYEQWLGEKRKVTLRKKFCTVSVLQAYPTPRQRDSGFGMLSQIMFPWFFEKRKQGYQFRYKPYMRTLSKPWTPAPGEPGRPVEKVLEMRFMGLEPSRMEKIRIDRAEKKALSDS